MAAATLCGWVSVGTWPHPSNIWNCAAGSPAASAARIGPIQPPTATTGRPLPLPLFTTNNLAPGTSRNGEGMSPD